MDNGQFIDISSQTNYTQSGLNNKTIALLNPFHYRSYYYDVETGFYYLNSRYYDPQIGRFINADDISYLDKSNLNGLNLYNYCLNNPVNLTDNKSTSWWSDLWDKIKRNWDAIVGTIVSVAMVAGGIALTIFTAGTLANIGATLIGAGVGSFLGGLQSKLNGNSYWGGYLGGFISGGLTGLGAFLGSVGVFVGGTLGNFLGTVVTDAINGVKLNDSSYWLNLAADSVLLGLIAIGSFNLEISYQISISQVLEICMQA